MENNISVVKITNFQAELSDMNISGKDPCQKVAKLHYITTTFEILVQNKLNKLKFIFG